jgi:hypothetical protein
MSLGVDNTGSDNGSNEIGSSGSTVGSSGSGTTDNCKDDNNCSSTDVDKFQKELNKSPKENNPHPGSCCSVSDLYSGTPKTTSPEEEKKEQEAKEKEKTVKSKNANSNATIGDETIESQDPLKGLKDLASFTKNIVDKVNVPVEVAKQVLVKNVPSLNNTWENEMEFNNPNQIDVTEALKTRQTNCSINCLNEESVQECLDSCVEDRHKEAEQLRTYNY